MGVGVRANRRQAPVGGIVGRGGDVERARRQRDLEAICDELGLEIRREAERHLEQVHVRVHAAWLLELELLLAP